MDFLGRKALNRFRSGFSLAEIHGGAHGIFPEPFSMQPIACFQWNTTCTKIINRATQGSANKLAMCTSPSGGDVQLFFVLHPGYCTPAIALFHGDGLGMDKSHGSHEQKCVRHAMGAIAKRRPRQKDVLERCYDAHHATMYIAIYIYIYICIYIYIYSRQFGHFGHIRPYIAI